MNCVRNIFLLSLFIHVCLCTTGCEKNVGKFLADPNDEQVKYISDLINISYNLAKFTHDRNAKYLHLSSVKSAHFKVQNGLIWYLRASLSNTQCSVKDLNLKNQTRIDLKELCLPNSITEDAICNFEAISYIGSAHIKLISNHCENL